MFEAIYSQYLQLMARPLTSWRRYLFDQIPATEKLIGIVGARGVGKTTLLLQLLREHKNYLKTGLYFSLDSLQAAGIDLYALAEQFEREGGELLVLDEVHHYPDFERTLKTIYDHLSIRVLFSGSSAWHLQHSKADLSRRAVVYSMAGLSFREYLNLTQNKTFRVHSLAEICENHLEITQAICRQTRPLAVFKEYLKVGYYPFFLQSQETYLAKLSQTISLSIDLDLPKVFSVGQDKLASLKKLLVLLSQSKPHELNISKLAAAIGVSRNTVYVYLNYLEQADLLGSVWGEGKNTAMMAKPEKLYLSNTNSFYALCTEPDVGALRETFFVSQLRQKHDVRYPAKADFLIDGYFLFEVGGESKTTKQLGGKDNAYLAVDDIEHGRNNRIPLWLFGFLY